MSRLPRAATSAGATVLLLALAACGGQTTGSAGTGSGGTGSGSTSSAGTASSASSSSPQSTGSPASHPTEFRPPGDIPDNAVYVEHRLSGSGGSVHLKVPEGWARSSQGGATIFTDHYNSISVQLMKSPSRPTPASVRSRLVPSLKQQVTKFANPKISQIQRAHGSPVLLTYLLDSSPDQVTGKVVRDAAERYLFWQHGTTAVLTLTGPSTADNVDPWRIVSDSLSQG